MSPPRPGPPLPTVLAIDDEPMNLSVYRRVLRRNYELVAASGSAEALAALEAGGIDVVLSDNRLRGEMGTWLAPVIRARWPRIPIIMLTGFVDAEVEALLEAGVIDRVVAKPIGAAELLQLLRDVLPPRR